MLLIKNLVAGVDSNIILQGLSIYVRPGEVHAILGPNGSGKSTLSSILAGSKDYKVISGEILFKRHNLLSLKPEERAGEGLFIAFQYPVSIPGVSNHLFLQTAVNTVRKYRKQKPLNRFDFIDYVNNKIKLLKMPIDLLSRQLNVGFSGGEKKCNDILQLTVLEPSLCVLDESDSGLDIDALKIIANCINTLRSSNRSFIIITHYQRILDYIHPNYVHVMHQGHIIKSGDFSLVKQIEEKGYAGLTTKE